MKLYCPHCDSQHEVSDSDAGKEVTCPSCGKSIALAAVVQEGETLGEFIKHTKLRTPDKRRFELEHNRLLGIHLDGRVWIKRGSDVSYLGEIAFAHQGVLEGGFGKFLKKTITGEGFRLTKAEGKGKLYLADAGKKISILHLNNEAIFVRGRDILAFEETISWDIKMMRKVAGVMAGGLFNVKLQGTGMIAITTDYETITLRAAPGRPVVVDPSATVAWSSSLDPDMKTNNSLKTFPVRGS